MQRDALRALVDWSGRPNRKPVVVRGARQVGKSFLVRMLAEAKFDGMVEVNFERDEVARELFRSQSPSEIVGLLAARTGVRIVPGRTLLFLDEIQAAPHAFAALRYFAEELPALHVVAAGSLLEFVLTDPTFSVPVGRIEYLHLGPMTFEEYLSAVGKPGLLRVLREWAPPAELSPALHADLMAVLRQYLIVGGMPEAVSVFVDTGSYVESDRVKQSVLLTYRDDFAKYGRSPSHRRLEKLLLRIPQLIGRKFVYASVDRGERSRELGSALELLCLARVAHRVRHSSANAIPLGAEAQDRAFKVLFMDVGLVCTVLGLNAADLALTRDPTLVNEGALAEQFVGQHLLYDRPAYEPPDLYCWIREKRNANAEVDYVLSFGETIVPVEVKAGTTGSLKSLHVFLSEKQRGSALRLNSDLPSLVRGRVAMSQGPLSFELLSLPLYMVGQARRLCREVLATRG